MRRYSIQPRTRKYVKGYRFVWLGINRLFVLSFKNGNNDPTRDSFNKYYMKNSKKNLNLSLDSSVVTE